MMKVAQKFYDDINYEIEKYQYYLKDSNDYTSDDITEFETVIDGLEKFKSIVESIPAIDGVVIDSFTKTTGGIAGRGNSFLIGATYEPNGEWFDICKLSDHSNYDHAIQLFMNESSEKMLSKLTVEAMNKVAEDYIY